MEVIIETEKTRLHRCSLTHPYNCYYVYIHRRLSDGKPFYVGKGKNYRAWSKSGRGTHWTRVVNKHGYEVEIVFEDLEEKEAFQCEVDVMLELRYFGYVLCNLNDGGNNGVPYEAVLRSANLRRGKPSWNKGLPSPKTVGKLNNSADNTVYSFIKHEGCEIFRGTRYDLCDKYNLNLMQIGKLFYTIARKTSQGWSLIKE